VLICDEVGNVFDLDGQAPGRCLGSLHAMPFAKCDRCDSVDYEDFRDTTLDELVAMGFERTGVTPASFWP
jgi:hypothetical protein